MGYHLNCPDEPVFITGPKPMLTEFGVHHGFESCAVLLFLAKRITLNLFPNKNTSSFLHLSKVTNWHEKFLEKWRKYSGWLKKLAKLFWTWKTDKSLLIAIFQCFKELSNWCQNYRTAHIIWSGGSWNFGEFCSQADNRARGCPSGWEDEGPLRERRLGKARLAAKKLERTTPTSPTGLLTEPKRAFLCSWCCDSLC